MAKKKEIKITALYERLSRDDEQAGESNSIQNQKKYFEEYARQHGLRNIRHFYDDGYFGTNFNRPGFAALLKEVEAGRGDMRSYERQGHDVLPTVHMGAAVSALERKGIETNIGNLNRDIKATNRMMNAIRSTIRNLRNWIADIMEATQEAFAETEAHELFTLEDLDTALQGISEKAKGIHADMKKASVRMKVITGIQNAVADCQTHKAVHDKYLKIGWKARQATFAESHKDELDSFNRAFRYLKKQGVDLNVNLDSLQAEYSKLQTTYAELAGQLAAAKEELQPMKDIRYWVSKVLTPEQSEAPKKPEPKRSVTEKMKFLQEQSSNQQEQKTTQQKKRIWNCKALAVYNFEDSECFFISAERKMHPAFVPSAFSYFPNKSLCVPVRDNVKTSKSFSIR